MTETTTDPSVRRRIELTVSCRDSDGIPKVPGAGEVVERDGVRVQVMHNGVLVREGAYHGAWMTEVIRRLQGHHEPQEELVVHEILKRCEPGGTMVELGSFWAYYAMWFARAVPSARLVLVEPDEPSLEVGREHLALNDMHGELVHAAVGAIPSPPAPFIRESDGATVEVPRVSVDSLVESLDIECVQLLLADVQGAETDVIEGARRSIAAGRIRFLVLSTHHHTISGDPLTHQRCLAAVRELGGHVVAEHSIPESFSGDGLIAASFWQTAHDLVVDVSRARACDSLFGELEYDLARALADSRNPDAGRRPLD